METQTNEVQTQLPISAQDSALANVDAETAAIIANAAKEQSSNETSGTAALSIKGKKFALGEDKLGITLNGVILADIYEHAYYDRAYNPDVITPPACFSIGIDVNLLRRHDVSPTPIHDDCPSCPYNQFASAANGKGKKCRNGRRLLLATLVDGRVDLGSLAILNIPPTSLKGYSSYVKRLTTLKGMPTWAVVTNFSFDQDCDWPTLVFEQEAYVHGEDMTLLAKDRDKFYGLVATPYDVSSYEPLTAPESTPTGVKKSKMS